jgi:hypothetical protein
MSRQPPRCLLKRCSSAPIALAWPRGMRGRPSGCVVIVGGRAPPGPAGAADTRYYTDEARTLSAGSAAPVPIAAPASACEERSRRTARQPVGADRADLAFRTTSAQHQHSRQTCEDCQTRDRWDQDVLPHRLASASNPRCHDACGQETRLAGGRGSKTTRKPQTFPGPFG